MTALALALLGFFVPGSTAGVSLALGLLVVAAALRYREIRAAAPWREPMMAMGLALLAYIAAHTLIATGFSQASRHAINQYHELFFAPLVLGLMGHEAHRRLFFRAFIAGCMALAVAYWVALAVPAMMPGMLTKRISAGFAFAVAAYLLVLRAPTRRLSPSHLLAAAFTATVLFAMDGRTGQLVVLLLAGCLAWHFATPRWRLPAAVAVVIAVVGIALTSHTVQARLDEFAHAWQRSGPPPDDDSSGVRLELLRITTHLAREHPLAGVGFGNYAQAHRQAAEEVYSAMPGGEAFRNGVWMRLGNPHDEYLMQLIGGGVASLLLFVAWLVTGLVTARRLPRVPGAMLMGVVLAFALGCVFNALLLNFVEGHIFMALVAWTIAEGRSPAAEEKFERVLVVATRQIGDVLLTSPLIRGVRELWPAAKVSVIGFEGTLGMLKGNPDVDELIETPPGRGWRSLTMAARLWRRWDLALVTDVGDRAHLIGWMAARLRAGIIPEQGRTNRLKRALLTHTVVSAGDLGTTHVVEEKQALLAPWNVIARESTVIAGSTRNPSPVPHPVIPPSASPLPAEIESILQPGAVIVHAPSMWSYKQWPVAHYAQVVSGLLANGHQVLLTGSTSPRDRECIAPLLHLGNAPQLLNVAGRLDFSQLVTLMGRAALYIGPDTSVSHLAAATGVPVIAIFGPTNPQRWGPWPVGEQPVRFVRAALSQTVGNVTLLQGSLACVPCGRAGCDNHRQSRADCLPDISAERVLTEARALLSVSLRRGS